MGLKITTYASIESGVLKIARRNAFLDCINALKDGRYVLTLERKVNKRSTSQNNYLWGVVYPVVLNGLKNAGYNITASEEVHDLLKYRFLKKHFENKDGEYIMSVGSTSELTTTEFMEYISNIKSWALEYLNTDVPMPLEEMEIKFE